MKIDYNQITARLKDMAMQHGCELIACGVDGDTIDVHMPTRSKIVMFLNGKTVFVLYAMMNTTEDGDKTISFCDEFVETVEPIEGFEMWFPEAVRGSAQ